MRRTCPPPQGSVVDVRHVLCICAARAPGTARVALRRAVFGRAGSACVRVQRVCGRAASPFVTVAAMMFVVLSASPQVGRLLERLSAHARESVAFGGRGQIGVGLRAGTACEFGHVGIIGVNACAFEVVFCPCSLSKRRNS